MFICTSENSKNLQFSNKCNFKFLFHESDCTALRAQKKNHFLWIFWKVRVSLLKKKTFFSQQKRNGIHVTDDCDEPVSSSIIRSESPFYVVGNRLVVLWLWAFIFKNLQTCSKQHQSAHIALIDSLMLAFASRAMQLENVVNAIKKYTKFNASSELPTNLEQLCAFWLNKITQTFLFTIDSECDAYARQVSANAVHVSRHELLTEFYSILLKLNIKCQPHIFIPKVNDITTQLANGSILAAIVLFYTCDYEIDISSKNMTGIYVAGGTWTDLYWERWVIGTLQLKRTSSFFCHIDVAFHENIGLEESVDNLNLIKEFCDKFIASRPFHFNFEDFLYSPAQFQINKIAFVAELFYWLECKPLICVQNFNRFKDYIKRMKAF